MKRLAFLLIAAASMLMAQRVRVVHASPDAPNVDVYVDGQIAIEDLPFGDYTDYVEVPSGQRNLAVFLAGTQTKVLEASPNLGAGQDFTVVAIGFASKAPALSLLLLNDASGNASDGQTRVRVVHASPTAPAVDVYFTAPYIARRNRPPVLSGVPFGVASGYLTVPAGQYQARVTPAGSSTVAINSGRLVIPQGAVRTIIAVDAKGGGGPLGAIVLLDRN
jgi:hypothetical protein